MAMNNSNGHRIGVSKRAKKCTRILNARAELLFCSLNLLFGDVFVGVDRRRDSSSCKKWCQDNEKISPGQGQVQGLDFVRQETISNVARLNAI